MVKDVSPGDSLEPSERERARLAALAAYGILDTPPEEGFDDIVLLARSLCSAPVALVSLVDRDRQWFKARSGFEPQQTPLSQSVCIHALGGEGLLVIPDLTKDARTAANTLVTQDPFLRFYAGAPLITPSGEVLGSLCVIDHAPRPEGLREGEASALLALARQVMSQMELRRAVQERDRALLQKRQGDLRHRQILDSALDHAILSLDPGGRITAWSRGAEALWGWGEDEALGREADFVFRQAGLSLPMPPISVVLDGASTGALSEGWRQRADGTRFFASSRITPLLDDGGVRTGWVVIVSERTVERRREDRLTLLAEASSALLSSQEPSETLASVLGAGAGTIGFDECYLFEVAEDGCHLHLAQGIGLDPSLRESLSHVPRERPLCGIVAETGEPLILSGLLGDGEPRHAIAREVGFDTYAGFPIISKKRVRGVISFSRRDAAPFDAETLVFFATLARFASVVHERIDAERELRASEAKWRGLFEELNDGFAVGRIVRDAGGRMLDLRYEAVNRAWCQMAGRPPGEVAGRTLRQIFPQFAAEWMLDFVRAEETGNAARFTRSIEALGRSYDGVMQVTEGDGFAILLTEVTHRAKAEAHRDALARIGDLLLLVEDEAEMLDCVTGLLGRTLDVAAVAYAHPSDNGTALLILRQWRREAEAGAIEPQGVLVEPAALERLRRGEGLVFQEAESGSTIDHPVMEDGRLAAVLHVGDISARRWSEEEIAFVRDAATRIRAALERRRVESLLRDNEKRLLTLVQTMPVGVLLAEARSGRLIASNRRMEDILGRPVASILPAADLGFVAFDGEGLKIGVERFPLWRMLNGEADRATLEAHLERPDGSRVWIEFLGEAIHDATGRLRGAVLCATDIEDRKRAEAQQRVLARELSHRLKNTLAVVQSIASQTLRSAPDIETARGTLSQRIQALSKAHEILLIGQRDAGSVEAILRSALEIHDAAGQIALSGPDLFVGPNAALSLALITHELATNAVKYGALSVPEGRVDVVWRRIAGDETREPSFELLWRERGGPPVTPPARKGFGTRLVGIGLSRTGQGQVELDYDPAGLCCRITTALSELAADQEM
ncbi:GAF domain-containing protein [Aureimonas ureilytica]|uniref:GAF domain-containing protein n=1 Tax=Aureimonas ureilytica TaxID=401562 RepID=UPI000AECAE37|nr:GAF domain-containing protein [Aureimonas ureilytica]